MNKKLLTRIIAFALAIFALITTCVGCKEPVPEEKAYTAPVRVMSYNILNIQWAKEQKTPAADRVGYLKNILDVYKPDVAGIQEVCQEWHTTISSDIVGSTDYAFACKSTFNKTYNMTTFIYNTKTVKPIQEYVFELEQNSDIRVLAVAVFERLSDGTFLLQTGK